MLCAIITGKKTEHYNFKVQKYKVQVDKEKQCFVCAHFNNEDNNEQTTEKYNKSVNCAVTFLLTNTLCTFTS